ncbi:redox-sensing transcriptional repressor Rex [Clostridium formicaceticum]|uniref:Redox-sensing transcriptional repressor Rex n=1 Tax=Clostridium formicaceticum TaxID=1497 RepID=A0AAC9RKQ4_9CLOT|nr:redox-sensing transcriptional repressor Rex [Clostridium formicaceticum]AOY75738.1 redox-sensing transcriptional repressor Rex [Clostridium formicaceticum]ARE86060.1 Redox-sensing transcriptional repressor Rex [Clostridium formicaceticum]
MAKNNKNISMAVIRRLPKYHRYLKELLDKEVYRISSKELSVMMGFTASQIRQDLNNFGGFGQQGYGYNVEELYREIQKILGLTITYRTVIIGSGNLGQAIANYTNFQKYGFKLLALFDTNPKLIGMKIRDVPVFDIDELQEFIEQKQVDIGIICTPKEFAQDIANKLVKTGVSAIWNFAPVDLKVPEHVIIENVHLSDSLFILSYLLSNQENF